MIYQCSITVEVDAESPGDASRKAQDMIDENTDYWVFEIQRVDEDQSVEIDAAKTAL